MSEEYSNKSLFNEAGFVIQRIHKMQDRINLVIRPNPLIWNNELNCYNYEIWLSDLTSLMNEVWGKLDTEERKKLLNLSSTIREAMDGLEIEKTINNVLTGQQRITVNKNNWRKIEKCLDLLEKEIKSALEDHGLGNPDIETGGF